MNRSTLAMSQPTTLGRPLASTLEWKRFLKAEERGTCGAYVSKPRLLERDRKAERSIRQDYLDRELLELVQNAADAAAELGGDGRVHIVISKEGLLVANTGEAFRDTGVEALLTAHLSDKPDRKIALIGAKGLGFRSILNWTFEPIILSGALRLAFSQEHATHCVRELAEKYANVRQLVGDHPERFAPILPFPIVEADIDRWLKPTGKALLAEAERLRASGYETVVAAPFRNEQSFHHAITQVNEFQPHFLLFVPSLVQIDIDIAGSPNRRWIAHADGDTTVLEICEGANRRTERWICRFDNGNAPLGDGDEGPRRFEVAVAIRADQTNSVGRLHSFFPTNVIVPLTALFHGTFELASNRKQLQDKSSLNDFVLSKLANLYASTLAELLNTGRITSAIQFLLRDRPFPPELALFEKRLLHVAREVPIVPTLGGNHVRAGASMLGPPGYLDFLPHRLFPAFALCRSIQERELFRALEVPQQDSETALREMAVADLSVDERAALIVGIARHFPENQHRREFLLDHRERPIPANGTCFPPASGSALPAPPDWARRRFVHPELWDSLLRHFGTTRRDVIHKLSSFGVQEYNLDGLARALVQQSEKVIRRSPDREPKVRADVLSLLQRLHAREATPPKWPGLKVKVLTQAGNWQTSDRVHLSESYGVDGRVNQALYAGRTDVLLAGPQQQGVDAEPEAASNFFRWIGVHSFPREVSEWSPEAYRADIMESLPDTFHVTDGSVTQWLEKRLLSWGLDAKFEAKLVYGLDRILADAPSEAILAWIARDPRLDTVAQHFVPRLQAQKNNAYFRYYSGRLPDLVRTRLERSRWLTCADGKRRAPHEVLRDPLRLEGIFARPARPDPTLSVAFGLDQALWNKGLANAGVGSTVQDVPEKVIYDILSDLPERGLPAEVVRRLYLQILERDDFSIDAAGPQAERFFESGTVQCRQAGQVVWTPIAQALYADRDGSIAAARERFALIDLPSRRSATNVSARFGVTPLSRTPIGVRVTSIVAASAATSSIIEHRFESALPFIRAYRGLISADSSALRRLDRLRMQVVTELQTELRLGDENFEAAVPLWSHLLIEDDLYIVVDENIALNHVPIMAAEVLADGLSDVFEIQSSAELAKLLSCESDAMRRLLLYRILPNFQVEEIEALISDPASNAADTVNFDLASLTSSAFFPAGTSEPGHGRSENDDAKSSALASNQSEAASPQLCAQAGLSEEATDISPVAENPGPSNPETVLVTSVENPEGRGGAGSALGLRIHYGYGGGSSSGTSQHDPYRPSDAEAWARRFEEQQGRFPLSVAHLQGRDALGCDTISFLTEMDRDAFCKDGNLGRIARFIEVKSGGVHLTENETAEAKKHKQRYYIYRIIFDDGGRRAATLTMINDPLSYASALARELRLDIEDVANRATFRVVANESADTPTAILAVR